MSELYQRFRSQRNGQVSRIAFWFVSELTFSVLATRIKETFGASETVDDYENVYEWSEFTSPDKRYFNLSFKHQDAVSLEKNPYNFFVEDIFFERDYVVHVGSTLATLSNADIYHGKVRYVSDDIFEYTLKELFHAGVQQ